MTTTPDVLIARLLGLHPKSIDLSLDRIRRLLDDLGRPQDRLPPVIHVAGTNGKGSTVAFMRAILEAAGQRVHVDTSPHLVNFNERIRIGRPGRGVLVDEAQLADALQRCETANRGEPITFWEILTAAAFLIFAEEPADVLLLEVGLGGRLDASNVVDHPMATVITPIGMDHADRLGDTIAKIAFEKAGIFKVGSPAIIAPQTYPDAEAVLISEATARPASIIKIGGQDFHVHEERGRLVYEDEDRLIDLPLPRLPGRHQHVNAATAIATLRHTGFATLATDVFERGLLTVDWPARMQRLKTGRLPTLAPAGADLWLDGAHNPDGGRVLAAALAERGEQSPAPLILIVGMLGTKDSDGFLKPFVGLAREVLAVPMPTQIAARSAEDVAAIARQMGLKASPFASVETALAALAQRCWDAPPRVVICGSLYLAGEVLAANGTPPT